MSAGSGKPVIMLAHYRLGVRLGAGGMGEVYKAYDTRLNRPVAIKFLPPNPDPARQQGLIQEAKAASALDHPNVIAVYEVAEAEGRQFIVMQYVEGRTLRQVMAGGRVSLERALHYAIQIADALGHAHARGIIHRDLKPGNIMITERDQVKVLDFGLAKLSQHFDHAEESTDTLFPPPEEGYIVGTAPYMSPEQARGGKLDARSDIFSFGALLYEMATGRKAFSGPNSIAMIASVLHEEPPPVSATLRNCPAELDRIIARALRKNPDRRWQSMADLRVALAELGEEWLSSSATATARAPRRGRWLIPVAVLILIAAVTGWFRFSRRGSHSIPDMQVTPLTAYPGMELHPALSPDGKSIAFSWDGERQDNGDIYVRTVGFSSNQRMTTHPAPETHPAWSPDGRRIAFLRRLPEGDAILLISAYGGAERRVALLGKRPGSRGLAWSPDGRFLATTDFADPVKPKGLCLISVDTGEKRALTVPQPPATRDFRPSFSPDGRALAFIRSFAGRGLYQDEILVLALDAAGAPRREPVRLISGDRFYCLDWTPDGRQIVFTSSRNGRQGLWRIGARSYGGIPQRVVAAGEYTEEVNLARKAPSLAFTRHRADFEIWQVPLSSRGVARPLISSTRTDFRPTLSPDGNHIAFVSDRSGSHEIWLADRQGFSQTQLTAFGNAITGAPSWSPDGRHIVFHATIAGNTDIYLAPHTGGAPQRLTTDPADDQNATWSGDGRWIYFVSRRTGASQIWKMESRPGASAVQLTRNGGADARESPEGQTLYFSRPEEAGLWSVPVGGGPETLVDRRALTGYWLPDRRGVYILDRDAKPGPLLSLHAAGASRPTAIVQFPAGLILAPGLAMLPGERHLLFTRSQRVECDIMLIENFR